MREIILKNQKFFVEDIPGTLSWGFWDFYSSGQWEPTTIEAADNLLKPGDLLFDIGAWVGPLTIWEARRGVNVVAVEPDPEAMNSLRVNCEANSFENVKLEEIAITNKSGMFQLGRQEVGADSQSSLIRKDLPGSVSVRGEPLSWLLDKYGKPNLIKIDVEGAESLIIPEYGPILRKAGVPVLLALHSNWYAPGTKETLTEELTNWNMKDLYNSMYLCTP